MDVKRVIAIIGSCFVVAGLVGACGDQFDPVMEVKKFRILGISINHPEVYPAEVHEEHAGPLVFDVLWHDPDNRDIQFGWVICKGLVPAGTNLEFCELLDEEDLPPMVVSSSEGGDSFVIPEVPPEMFDSIPILQQLKATAIVLLCAGGQLPDADEIMDHQGTSNLNELCQGGDGLSAYKFITFSHADEGSDDANENPEIENLMFGDEILTEISTVWDGDPTVIDACESSSDCDFEIEIEAIVSPDQYQTYTVIDFGEPVQTIERLFVSWFSTGGEFEMPHTVSNSPSEPFIVKWNPKEPGDYLLWAVAHDLRGGVSWKQYSLRIQ